MIGALLWIPAFAGMTGEALRECGGDPLGGSPIILRHSRVGGNIKYDTSFVGWAKRSVPNALEASIPDVCQSTCLNCQAAKSDVPTSGFSGYWSRLCRVFPWLCCP